MQSFDGEGSRTHRPFECPPNNVHENIIGGRKSTPSEFLKELVAFGRDAEHRPPLSKVEINKKLRLKCFASKRVFNTSFRGDLENKLSGHRHPTEQVVPDYKRSAGHGVNNIEFL